jgi:hypothetical protein
MSSSRTLPPDLPDFSAVAQLSSLPPGRVRMSKWYKQYLSVPAMTVERGIFVLLIPLDQDYATRLPPKG